MRDFNSVEFANQHQAVDGRWLDCDQMGDDYYRLPPGAGVMVCLVVSLAMWGLLALFLLS